MRLGLAAAAWTLLALAGYGCGDDSVEVIGLDMQAPMPDAATDPDAGEPEDAGGGVTVSIGPGGSNRFAPQTIFVPVGGTVTWLWVTGVHGVVSDDDPPAFDPSPTQGGGRYTVTFASAGQFGYHCSVHGTMMSGVVVVE